MIRMFSYFENWCSKHGLDPDQYRVTITPLSPTADDKLQYRWTTEMQGKQLDPTKRGEFNEGHLFGIPFKIDRLCK